jgi:creatinine amidohydrolase/Fe(II)-dependent formamide hydrolase-like protein
MEKRGGPRRPVHGVCAVPQMQGRNAGVCFKCAGRLASAQGGCMKLHEMLPGQCEKAKREKWPLFIPAGTIEYHGEHLPLGVDTIAVLKSLEELEKQINCIVAPPVWYGPSSYAVAGPEKGTIDVDADRFEKHCEDVLRGLLESGYRRIFVVIHHQFEMGRLMPEALAFQKSAYRIIFERLERERGRGWWGTDDMESYYESIETFDNPFNWVQVVPLMSPEIQKEMGYDHAGLLETSLMLAAVPDRVDMRLLEGDRPWFTRGAENATPEHGEKTIRKIVEYLIELTST